MTKRIALGTSKLLKMYLAQTSSQPFAYCIDDFTDQTSVGTLPIRKTEALDAEIAGTYQIIIFAVSSRSLQAIFERLYKRGLRFGTDFILYSDFFYDDFVKKAQAVLGWPLDPKLYRYAVTYTLNSVTAVHTTILGTWLILEIIKATHKRPGQWAEVGMFQGGNALSVLSFSASLETKEFYLFDSFEGFPDLGGFDPATSKKGDYKIETTLEEVFGRFAVYPNAHVIKGFVPETFKQVPPKETFSFVFYDCDLYQPALDTFAFFWDKLVPGGFLVVHDYHAEEGGFAGVKKAVEEFFVPRKIPVHSFFQNTMAVLKKPSA